MFKGYTKICIIFTNEVQGFLFVLNLQIKTDSKLFSLD